MAVKERKQITGTTAQIQAYKGHEGQIVWDKEKKTLVGMSGTAGKNYPLAPQAYVDNEVSKVNAEVAKKASSAELTQGLAGKEDKGVCLPKTGGELTGSLVVKGSAEGASVASIYNKDQSSELMLSSGDADWTHGGGALALYGRNHSYKGGFNLLGVADGDSYALSAIAPDFTLRWKHAAVVTGILENISNAAGYMKFNNISDSRTDKTYSYFAIVWTDFLDIAPGYTATTTLPIPLGASYFYTYQAASGTTNSPVLEFIDTTRVRIVNTDGVARRLRMVAYGAL